jgi:hypothetical protein
MMQSLLRILIAKDSNEFFIGYDIHSERSAMFNHVNYNDVLVDTAKVVRSSSLCRFNHWVIVSITCNPKRLRSYHIDHEGDLLDGSNEVLDVRV